MDSAVAACASKGLDREPQVSPLDAATLEESAKGTCLSRSCSAVAGVLLVFLGFVRGRTRDDSLLLALAGKLVRVATSLSWFFVDYSSSSAGALLDFGTRNLLLLGVLLGKLGKKAEKLDIRVCSTNSEKSDPSLSRAI